MTFSQIGTGGSIFLDANVLVYHFEPHAVYGPMCSQLLARIEQQNLVGFTSTHVLSEVAHRLMMVEASGLPGWGVSKVKQRLQKHPSVVQSLTRFRAAVETVLQGKQFLSSGLDGHGVPNTP